MESGKQTPLYSLETIHLDYLANVFEALNLSK